MTILVTGATGFVGINLVKMLAERGDSVVGLYRSAYSEFVPWFLGDLSESSALRLIHGDITSEETMKELSDMDLDGIIHSAVITPSARVEREIPARICEVNFSGTVRLLELARQVGMERFLYVSSSGIYGDTGDDVTPVPEDTHVSPSGLYGVTKLASEGVVERYGELFPLACVSARIGAPYGPGERPTGSREIMSPILEMTAGAVEGRPVSLRNPHISRDWTHILDTCGALIALYNSLPLSQPMYNVSRGESHDLECVAGVLARIIPGAEFFEAPDPREADTGMSESNRRGPLDVSRLIADTGFQPGIDLDEGLQDYANWLKKYRQWLAS
ncbi:MAG: NAD-dependent epimerase/dehydratase family protein [Clostridia bacterium]